MYYPKERNMIIFDVDGPKDSPSLDSQNWRTDRPRVHNKFPGNEKTNRFF
jgi:hypothetical protein